jgi:hypothetical protein
MNINFSNSNTADNVMATMFPRLYMATMIFKIVLFLIVLYFLYTVNKNKNKNVKKYPPVPAQTAPSIKQAFWTY